MIIDSICNIKATRLENKNCKNIFIFYLLMVLHFWRQSSIFILLFELMTFFSSSIIHKFWAGLLQYNNIFMYSNYWPFMITSSVTNWLIYYTNLKSMNKLQFLNLINLLYPFIFETMKLDWAILYLSRLSLFIICFSAFLPISFSSFDLCFYRFICFLIFI